ncbi:hypothetical protein OAB57_00280 [Bacteriovoracaceae bacterium]|nr:hypothetical protein [Bacteriovoracaceae bacterium]
MLKSSKYLLFTSFLWISFSNLALCAEDEKSLSQSGGAYQQFNIPERQTMPHRPFQQRLLRTTTGSVDSSSGLHKSPRVVIPVGHHQNFKEFVETKHAGENIEVLVKISEYNKVFKSDSYRDQKNWKTIICKKGIELYDFIVKEVNISGDANKAIVSQYTEFTAWCNDTESIEANIIGENMFDVVIKEIETNLYSQVSVYYKNIKKNEQDLEDSKKIRFDWHKISGPSSESFKKLLSNVVQKNLKIQHATDDCKDN